MRLLNLREIKDHETLIKQIAYVIRLSVSPRDDKQTQVTRPVIKELLKLLESTAHNVDSKDSSQDPEPDPEPQPKPEPEPEMKLEPEPEPEGQPTQTDMAPRPSRVCSNFQWNIHHVLCFYREKSMHGPQPVRLKIFQIQKIQVQIQNQNLNQSPRKQRMPHRLYMHMMIMIHLIIHVRIHLNVMQKYKS